MRRLRMIWPRWLVVLDLDLDLELCLDLGLGLHLYLDMDRIVPLQGQWQEQQGGRQSWGITPTTSLFIN